jgi:hypothetical protein
MSDPTKPRSPWWDSLVPGVALLFGSCYVWWYLTEMERKPGPHRLPRAAVLLYNWAGKWGVVLLVAGVGALFTVVGASKLIRRLRERRLPPDANHSPGNRGQSPSTETTADHPREMLDEGVIDDAG